MYLIYSSALGTIFCSMQKFRYITENPRGFAMNNTIFLFLVRCWDCSFWILQKPLWIGKEKWFSKSTQTYRISFVSITFWENECQKSGELLSDSFVQAIRQYRSHICSPIKYQGSEATEQLTKLTSNFGPSRAGR